MLNTFSEINTTLRTKPLCSMARQPTHSAFRRDKKLRQANLRLSIRRTEPATLYQQKNAILVMLPFPLFRKSSSEACSQPSNVAAL